MIFPISDNNRTRRTSLIVPALIALNVVALIWLQWQSPVTRFESTLTYGFVPARLAHLRTGAPVDVELRQWVRVEHLPHLAQMRQRYRLPVTWHATLVTLVSCMFLHAGWGHLLGNMWFLWIFGNNVEDRLGHVRFLAFYLLGGMFASLCHWFTAPESTVPVIGASGAIAAVLGAYAVTFPRARIRTLVFLFVFVTFWDLPALVVLGVWFLGQLAQAQHALRMVEMSGGVAWWAHVGGFVAGAVLMPLWRDPDPALADLARNPTLPDVDYWSAE